MCESTVKVHIRNIMKKLKATNRTQVVYLTNGLFETGSQPRRPT
jgi:DNA-binding NarL/FixJ family response regulator